VLAEEVSHQWGFAISAIAGTDVALPLTFAAAAILLALRHWRGAIALVLAVLATQAVVQVIKLLVERPRPSANGAVAEAGGFSFPSAHSATSVAVYATIAFILIRASRRGYSRVAVAALAGGLVFLVGLSRVLLGAHYPTDVLAGWTFGALLASLCWLVATRAPLPLPRLSFNAAR
jgi:undecaprenyl-diphosphatase